MTEQELHAFIKNLRPVGSYEEDWNALMRDETSANVTMTVQEILKTADLKKMAMLEEMYWPEYEKPLDKDRYVQVIADFIARMCEKTPSNPEDCVMLALPYREEHKTRIMAEYFEKKDLLEAVENIKNTAIPLWVDLEIMTDDEINAWIMKAAPLVPQGYGIEFSKWETVLAAKVYTANIDRDLTHGRFTPGSMEGFTRRDQFLHSLISDMTFNGVTEESQAERRAELDRSIAEAEEIKNLPEEERQQRYINAETLFEDFGLEPPTKEELERRRHEIVVDCAKTRIAWIDEIVRLAKTGALDQD